MPGLTELGRQWNDAVGSADQPWNTLGLSPGMTHEAEQPNPVPGIVEGMRKYLQSGDYTPIHELGTQPADYLRELARNPDIMAKNIAQASQFNFGGATELAGIANKIRAAYKSMSTEGNAGWVSLTKLRQAVPEYSREEMDAALKQMSREQKAILSPDSNQKTLTAADRDAALHLGGEAKHLISIEP